MLLLALALATDSPPLPTEAAAAYEAGVAALHAKDGPAARAAFDRCLVLAPGAVECRWERGWAAWLVSDWGAVVQDWEAVAASHPDWPGLQSQLASARAQRDLVARARAARDRAPKTVPVDLPPGTTLRLRAVGDLMIGTAFPEGYLPPDGGSGTFAAVGDLLRDADLTFGNLEGPLCDTLEPSDKCRPDAAPGSCYAFRTPTAYGRWYQEAGFDVVSTANNHAGDFGEGCRQQTEATLDRLGILHTGRPGTVATTVLEGLKVAVIGFHSSMATHNLNDLPTATGLVRELAAEHDVVIVSFHGGAEGSKAIHVPRGPETFYGEDRGDLRAFTHAVVDAGADLVLGHGPHVPRGMELYQDRLIAYSLGNFATYGRFNVSGNQGLGVVLEVTLLPDGRFAAGRIHGTRQEGEGRPVPDPASSAADLVRTLTEADFPEWGVVVAQDGSLGPRPTP